MTFEERFAGKFDKAEPDECWLWKASFFYTGYGQSHNVAGKGTTAHRVSHELYVGPIPEGMHVLHKCDVRACVNPSHLFLGTHADNMADMYAKGRQPSQKGTDSGRSKLTEAQVLEIRASNEGGGVLGRQYGVTRKNISSIRLRQSWKHI